MEDKHICTDVTSPLWKSCQFEAVRDWDRPGLCNVVRRSSSKTTFCWCLQALFFFFFFFSPSCLRRRPPVPEQPLSHQQTSGIPRATIARSESLDCRDENRLFSWSGAKAIKKVIFFFPPSLGDCEIPPPLPVSALTQSQRGWHSPRGDEKRRAAELQSCTSLLSSTLPAHLDRS